MDFDISHSIFITLERQFNENKNPLVKMAFVVVLQVEKLICIPENWVQNQTIGEESLIFFSNKNTDTPKFDLEQKYYFTEDSPACYNARVCQRFGKYFFWRIL